MLAAIPSRLLSTAIALVWSETLLSVLETALPAAANLLSAAESLMSVSATPLAPAGGANSTGALTP